MATLQFIKTSAPFIKKKETIVLEQAYISTPNTLNKSFRHSTLTGRLAVSHFGGGVKKRF